MRYIRRYAIIVILVILVINTAGCNTPEIVSETGTYQHRVDALRSIQPGYPWHDDRIVFGDKRFNINEYFSVLTHLSMRPGYVLDYFYWYDHPIIYARKAYQPPYLCGFQYEIMEDTGDYTWYSRKFIDYLQIDDTPEGYFEFITLLVMGEQFYLFWHGNYNDATIICDNEGLDALIEDESIFLSREVAQKACSLDFTPVIELKEDVAIISVVIFTQWGGFIKETTTVSRCAPHYVLDSTSEVLIEYQCGIMY